jgi:hypothetical protein
MLFVTAAARHLWILLKLGRDVDRKLMEAKKRISSFEGLST